MFENQLTLDNIFSILKGCYLFINGNNGLEQYNFKSREEKFNYNGYGWMLEKFHSENEVRLFAAALNWNNIFYKEIIRDHIRFYEDWKYRRDNPILIMNEFENFSIEILSSFIKDGITGPKMLNCMLGQQLHFVSFCYLDELTKASDKWNSINWKIVKNKIINIKKLVDIPSIKVVQFARYLKSN